MWDMMKVIWFNQAQKTNQNLNPNSDSTVSLQNSKPLFPIVLHYNAFESNLAGKFKHILTNSMQLDNYNIVKAFKIHPNLKRLLVHSELKPLNTNIAPSLNASNDYRFTVCNNSRCLACKLHAYNCDSFTSSTFNAVFHFNDSLTCRTTNIIYLITCVKCNKQYVGETGRCLGDRLCNHRSCILTKKSTPIAIHFNKPGHSIERDFRALPIEKITEGPDALRLRRERELFWWGKLGTRYPFGLNAMPV